MGEAYGGAAPDERFAGAAIVPEPVSSHARGRSRRIVPIAGRGLLRWYDPSDLKGQHWLEQLSNGEGPTRRVHAVARAYVLLSTAVLVVVLLSFSGRPPVATVALAFGCVLVAAYLAVSSVRSLPVLRRRAARQAEEIVLSAPVPIDSSDDVDRLRPSA